MVVCIYRKLQLIVTAVKCKLVITFYCYLGICSTPTFLRLCHQLWTEFFYRQPFSGPIWGFLMSNFEFIFVTIFFFTKISIDGGTWSTSPSVLPSAYWFSKQVAYLVLKPAHLVLSWFWKQFKWFWKQLPDFDQNQITGFKTRKDVFKTR